MLEKIIGNACQTLVISDAQATMPSLCAFSIDLKIAKAWIKNVSPNTVHPNTF